MTCPDCERYKQSAAMWRHKAYELGGTSLPWKPEELLREEYERGLIDGMQKQMQSSVDKAVEAEREAVLQTIEVLYDTQDPNPMYQEGYNHALDNLKEFVKARGQK